MPTSLELQALQRCTKDTLGEQLKQYGLSDETCRILYEQNYCGESFFTLRLPKLNSIISDDSQRLILQEIIVQKTLEKSKVFLDPVYGEFQMHPLVTRIIDTPELQRLRDIKQLEGAYKVYCGASHNRFQHSIGVCHLAGEFGRMIKKHQPELMNDKDILCLEIAGLCHDIGQGPFSRLFDNGVIPYVERSKDLDQSESLRSLAPPTEVTGSDEPSCRNKDMELSVEGNSANNVERRDQHVSSTRSSTTQRNYQWVRVVSAEMFQCLARRLQDDFEFYGLHKEHDVQFIKSLINPPKDEQDQRNALESKFKRPGDRLYLFQIVSNRKNEIDVDRFDYLARDSLQTGLKTGFDYQRILMHMRVVKHGDTLLIGFRDKVAPNVYDLFTARYQLYRSVYMHQPTMVVSLMIAEAFKLASDCKIFSRKKRLSQGLQCSGEDLQLRKDNIESSWSIADVINEVREVIENDESKPENKDGLKSKERAFKNYMKLSDSLYYRILYSTEDDLQPARQILKRLEERKLFLLVGKTKPTEKNECFWEKESEDGNVPLSVQENNIREKILQHPHEKEDGEELNAATLIVKIVCVGYGTASVHPTFGVTYFRKDSYETTGVVVPDPPVDFKNRMHRHLRVFFAGKSYKLLQEAQKVFRKYCEANNVSHVHIPKHPLPNEHLKTPQLVDDRNGFAITEEKQYN